MSNYKLLLELQEVLTNTVPKKDHAQLIVMLCRVNDALESAIPHIRNQSMAKDAKLICSLVDGFLSQQQPEREFYDIYDRGIGGKKVFNAYHYLQSKGVRV